MERRMRWRSFAMVSTERGTGEGAEGRDEQAMTVDGHSVWKIRGKAEPVETNTRDHLQLDACCARWEAHSASGDGTVIPIESASPAVRGFIRRVVAQKTRIARSVMTRPAVPK